ncbi:unnamed protein product [Rotaria sp. Silwood2]|nr:unnamed protein product [Rotaria sp. Silwood2]CAF4007086.1 unnamed protein product [Rotaria sp. Silwood2]
MRRQITAPITFIIAYDEKYFILSNDDMPQNIGFYSFDTEHPSDNVKYKTKEKYPKHVLSLVSLISKSKLVQFIEVQHVDEEYIFWPNLASSHYADETTQWFLQYKINFVPKQINPSNVPKARPIEDFFWSILASKIYEGG